MIDLSKLKGRLGHPRSHTNILPKQLSRVQLIEGYVLTPMIAGKATNLDPVTILVVVLAGGSIMGIYGMLLAIPVAACLKILCTDVLLPKVHAWTAGEAEDPLPIDRD